MTEDRRVELFQRADAEVAQFRRNMARLYGVPEHLIGLRVPWWRRVWQRWTRRP